MRMYALIPVLLISLSVQAQNFEDGFSDGDFTAAPVWSGDVQNFRITDLDWNPVIQLFDQRGEAGTSFLSTPSTDINGYWEFWVQIDGSTPSGSNNVTVFLMSDIQELSGPVNGYAVRAGETGDDVFRLIRVDAGEEAEILLSDTTVLRSGSSYQVRVERQDPGNWSLQVGVGYDAVLNDSGMSAADTTYTESSYFGFKIRYTRSRTEDYFLDFKIDSPPVIIEPLKIDSLRISGERELELSVNRSIHFEGISTDNFLLNDNMYPDGMTKRSEDQIGLIFPDAFQQGMNELKVSGIQSENSDTVLTDTTITFFYFGEPVMSDVIINEFLKDPPPESGLPEYIELRNNSTKVFNLKNWKAADEHTLVKVSESDLILYPDSFIVLTEDPGSLSEVFGPGNYIEVALPALNNSGDQIRIFDANRILMDSLAYTSDWGGVDIALERRLAEAATTLRENWGESPSGIGSPGRINQIEADLSPPELIRAEITNQYSITLSFSEKPEITSATSLENYQVQPANEVIEVLYSGPEITLTFIQSFKDGESFTLTVTGIRDVFGNEMDPVSLELTYVYLSTSLQHAIFINEILFDPLADNTDGLPDQAEYIELFNRSDTAVSLEVLRIHDAPDENGEVRYLIPVTTQNKWIPAKGFFLIYAEDVTFDFTQSKVYQYYELNGQPEEFTMQIERSSLSLSASGDAVFISDTSGTVIDSVFYEESWHNPNLYDTKGIALEKIDPEGSSNKSSNWSSAVHAGGGTPLSRNSIYQQSGQLPENTGIRFSPNPFSPDGDGFEDHVFINYSLDAPDYLLRIRIFDRYGREVRKLADGIQAGFEGSLIWDGLTDDRRICRVGIYIVLFEAYDSASGKDRVFKETVVLARKF